MSSPEEKPSNSSLGLFPGKKQNDKNAKYRKTTENEN